MHDVKKSISRLKFPYGGKKYIYDQKERKLRTS